MKTTSTSLQESLDLWSVTLNSISALKSGDIERKNALRSFTLLFVPLDVNEEDSNAYADSLYNDDEYFESLRHEMNQCSSGNGVESIQGDQIVSAIFTLNKPEGSDITIDIVRELSFASLDNGQTWRAEG